MYKRQLHIDANAHAGSIVDIDAGVLDIDVTAGVTLDAAASSTLTVATGGADGDDFTVQVTGGGDSSLLLASDGTGADAVSIDVTAGSMVIAPSLADAKTLKLGKNGAVEMVFTPHGTAGNELFSVTNTAGTAANAVLIEATAGGITLTADSAVIPGDNGGTDLGSTTKRWANIYTSDMHFANERGDWTLIEENDYITFRNNRTGRRFRMMMEDITDSGDFGPDINGDM